MCTLSSSHLTTYQRLIPCHSTRYVSITGVRWRPPPLAFRSIIYNQTDRIPLRALPALPPPQTIAHAITETCSDPGPLTLEASRRLGNDWSSRVHVGSSAALRSDMSESAHHMWAYTGGSRSLATAGICSFTPWGGRALPTYFASTSWPAVLRPGITAFPAPCCTTLPGRLS